MCTEAVLLDVDPVGIVRGRGGKDGAEDQYVNDRQVTARCVVAALGGGLALVQTPRWAAEATANLTSRQPSCPSKGVLRLLPAAAARRFFARCSRPLGYTVEATSHDWTRACRCSARGRLFTVTLERRVR